MQYDEIPTSTIKVGERFRKDLGDLSPLLKSIKDKGFIQPISIDAEYNLLAGRRRLECAYLLDLKIVPCVVHRVNSSLDALTIELVENSARKDFGWSERAALEKRIFQTRKAADSKWTQDQHSEFFGQSVGLTSMLLTMAEAVETFPELATIESMTDAFKAYKQLRESIIRKQNIQEVERDEGDEEDHVAQHTGSSASALPPKDHQPDEAPGPTNVSLKIAKSNYKLGDALKGLKSLRPGEYHFANVDPPYAIDLDHVKDRGAKPQNRIVHSYQEWDADTYERNIFDVAGEVYRALFKHAYVCWWFGPTWYELTRSTLKQAGFHVYDIPCIWYKGAQGVTANPNQMPASCYEMFFLARKGDPVMAKPGRSNVFEFPPVPSVLKAHATEKPQGMMEDILETFTFEGARCIVPFLGSGVDILAGYKTKRIVFGWDTSSVHQEKFLGRVADLVKREQALGKVNGK